MAAKIYLSGSNVVIEPDGAARKYFGSFTTGFNPSLNGNIFIYNVNTDDFYSDIWENFTNKQGQSFSNQLELETYLSNICGRVSGGSNGGGSSLSSLYMELNSVQDLNVISPFTDLDFIAVTNEIQGATVSSEFPLGGLNYKGVVTLPAGIYESSFKINAENMTNTQKVIVTNISRYAPTVEYYPSSTVYEMYRNRNFATLANPTGNYTFLRLTEPQSFGIISARAAAAGGVNTIPDQSYWKITKLS